MTSAKETPAPEAVLDRGGCSSFFGLLFGGILPLICILVELGSRTWTDLIFDPIPSYFHVVVIAFISFVNIWVALSDASWSREKRRWAAAAIGLAAGFSLVYLIAFTVTIPLALLGLLAMGLGLLPLTPVLCFFATFSNLRWLIERRDETSALRTMAWRAALFAFVLMCVIDARGYLLRADLKDAVSADPETRIRALQRLRSDSRRDRLTAAFQRGNCGMLLEHYVGLIDESLPPTSDPDLFESEGWTANRSGLYDTALYYRITGKPLPIETDLDGLNLAGVNASSWREPKLVVSSSRLEASVDLVGATAQVDWELVVSNDQSWPLEGMLRFQVDPEAVISRARLWIEGEAREAAFAPRAAATHAYETVTQRERRDPLLVSKVGPGLFELQFSPVPAQGIMKFAIGISLPLDLVASDRARLVLPSIAAQWRGRAWGLPSVWAHPDQGLVHALSIRSGSSFSLLGSERRKDRAAEVHPEFGTRLEVSLEDRDHPGLAGVVLDVGCPGLGKSQAPDPIRENLMTLQVPGERRVAARRAVVVIDGSLSMAGTIESLVAPLEALTSDCLAGVVLVGDRIESFSAPAAGLRRLQSMTAAGGQDGYLALTAGLALAAEQKAEVLVWIHGEQPLLFQEPDDFGLDRRNFVQRGKILDFPVTGGLNLVANQMLANGSSEREGGIVDLEGQLVRRIREECGQASRRFMERTGPVLRAELARVPMAADTGTRLRLGAEIEQLAGQDLARAEKLGQEYGLVTSVTSAVCLETAADYERFKLDPKAPELMPSPGVPTVPEPETWALIAFGLVIAGGFVLLRGRAG